MQRMDMRRVLDASTKIGYDRDEIVYGAVKMFLDVNREMRESIAIELYEEGEISMGKACEIADLSYEDMKNLLRKSGILLRRGPASAEELRVKAKELTDML